MSNRKIPVSKAIPLQFLRNQAGSLAVFSVFVFVAMLMVAGLAIDLMRYENVRLRMQDTADRAVLAATMLRDNDPNITPEMIVESYFAAEGLSAQIEGRIFVQEDAESGRTVTVAPAATVPSLFMRLLGIDEFAVVTPASANENLDDLHVEVVLVLDVSGSMSGSGKIDAMRTAASQLVQTLLADNENDRVAVTIVPYDAYVLPPPGMLNHFTNVSGTGACPDWTVWNTIENSLTQQTYRANCNTAEWAQVRPLVANPAEAVNHISGLVARGTTAIDLGVRNGALFFDPSIRPAVSAMIANGQISSEFEGRPFDWDEPNVIRTMILLTDGENCCGERYTQLQQNENTLSVCDALKDHDVVVYAIAFQAPENGANLMRNCASSPSHFFNADVSEIISVFQGIASHIQVQALRLTL